MKIVLDTSILVRANERSFGIARALLTTPRFWLNLQAAHDLEIAEDRVLAEVNNQVQPLSTVTA